VRGSRRSAGPTCIGRKSAAVQESTTGLRALSAGRGRVGRAQGRAKARSRVPGGARDRSAGRSRRAGRRAPSVALLHVMQGMPKVVAARAGAWASWRARGGTSGVGRGQLAGRGAGTARVRAGPARRGCGRDRHGAGAGGTGTARPARRGRHDAGAGGTGTARPARRGRHDAGAGGTRGVARGAARGPGAPGGAVRTAKGATRPATTRGSGATVQPRRRTRTGHPATARPIQPRGIR
jgi:hypothetical protein